MLTLLPRRAGQARELDAGARRSPADSERSDEGELVSWGILLPLNPRSPFSEPPEERELTSRIAPTVLRRSDVSWRSASSR